MQISGWLSGRIQTLFVTLTILTSCLPLIADEEGRADHKFFETRIRPVLVRECYSCHSADSDEIEGGLALDTRAGIRKGGERGAAVVPGSVRQSLLVKAIRHADEHLQMPPDKKLPADVIADFELWITNGALDPRDGDATVVEKYRIDMDQAQKHWAFQAPKPVQAPRVSQSDWPRNDIDYFVLAALEDNRLHPVDDADRRTLLRRLTFDLIGLPPTPDEVKKFASDESGEALEEAVDRLLASPRFGEKWARHWLDVARYAESTGKTVNFYYPQAWRYRDYVISAFNDDKPYDEFIREQIAGDLMSSEDPDTEADRLIATGFLALGPKTLNERSGLKYELDIVDEQIDVTSQAFLGITVACSRCHDHKFDPIPQADYYALAGIFRSTETHYGTVRYINAQRATQLITLPEDASVAAGTDPDPLTDRERGQVEAQIDQVRQSIRNSRDGLQSFFAMGRVALLQSRLDAFEDDGTPRRLAMGVTDKPQPSRYSPRFGSRSRRFGDYTFDGMRSIGDSPIFLRGEHDQPSNENVPRGTLQILTSKPLDIAPTTSGRLELANWIANPENPLTARVIVNRIWLQLFGSGIVPTSSDFGLAGRPPTHPELLDYLAIQFMNDGWSIKKLVRHLVTSRVYQLSTATRADALEYDPDNIYLWRMQPRRLDAEALRDAILAVSGQLNTTPPVGSAVSRSGEGPVSSFSRRSALRAVNDPRNSHRSIYLPVIRDNLPESLGLFDGADPSLITSSREQTTVPSQGLFLLNNDFVMRAADAAADQLLQIDHEPTRIESAFLRFYGRPPHNSERDAAMNFVSDYQNQILQDGVPESRRQKEVWSAFCQALFASGDFQYRK